MLTLDYKKINQKFQTYTRELDIDNHSYIYGEVDYQCINKILRQFSILENRETFIDIGSGCGKLIVGLAKDSLFEENIFTGIEIHKPRYENSLLLQQEYDCYNNTEFILGDFRELFLGKYDVLYCCNTIFGEKENNSLFNKINREFKGYFIVFVFDKSIEKYLIKKFSVHTSWLKNTSIYLFYKNEIIIQ